MNKYLNLIKNTALFGIGNVLSKIILFLLMPLYTSVLSTSEYGIAEMFSTSLELFFPLITLGVSEAVFRYTIDKNDNVHETISIGFFITTLGLILSILISFLLSNFFGNYFVLLIFMILTYSYKTLFSYASRGLEKNAEFAISGILNTFILAVSNIYFLKIMKIGLNGYLLSIIISNSVSALYLLICSKLYKYISVSYFKKNKCLLMLRYCIPTIPNQLSWWIINMSGRYILLFFFSNGLVGLYTAASKIPSTINIITQMFQQAWQFSSSQEINSNSSLVFYSKIYKVFLSLMVMSTSIIITFSPLIAKFLLKGNFYSSWKFIPMLLIVSFLNSISMFFGTFYVAYKKSNMLMYSTILGVIINVCTGIPLGYLFSIEGITFSSLLTYLVLVLVRIYDTQKFVEINLFIKMSLILFVLLLSQVVLIRVNILYSLIITFIIIIILLFFLKNQIAVIYNRFR